MFRSNLKQELQDMLREIRDTVKEVYAKDGNIVAAKNASEAINNKSILNNPP